MVRRGLLWFGLGFLALALGNAVGAVHMFRGNVVPVMVGVALMFAGYQVMHYGAHGEGLVSVSGSDVGRPSAGWVRPLVVPGVLLVVAIYCISQGFVIGARAAVTSFGPTDMVATGTFIVGGYMTGHVAVHGVPL